MQAAVLLCGRLTRTALTLTARLRSVSLGYSCGGGKKKVPVKNLSLCHCMCYFSMVTVILVGQCITSVKKIYAQLESGGTQQEITV
jgi:hypothetical protein